MNKRSIVFLVPLLVAAGAGAVNWPEHPVLHAVRVASGPVIDGDLSDEAWKNAPEFTDFTQHDPDDGKPPTMPTSVRIVYDEHAIYFGIKVTDPEKPTAPLARRDNFNGQSDFLSINIDSRHDRLSGAAFTITPSNVQIDSILYNDIGEDGSWDGVWDSAVKMVPGGWIAEVRVPFSQLRFPDKPVHVWGINITRRTVRNNEWVRIVNTRKGETGFVSHFADIDGLEGIHRGRPLEIVPYSVARSDLLTRRDPNNPLLKSNDYRAAGGLDVKYGLTSDLTFTGTINPDFGQVEVDPAVVNLSQFETFYPEKRPFFTEGLNIFQFGDTPAPSHFNFFSPPSLFYTRRIGRAPQGLPAADFVDAPSETTILGAAKVTGKLGGFSVGVLDALTDAEHARFVIGPVSGRQQVEPMTNYFISRGTKEISDGSRVGFMLTSVNRRLPDELMSLRDSAVTGGVDGYTSFLNKSWILEGSAVGSEVTGSPEAIANAQTSSARYYQRPDSETLHFDPTRTSLDGWGGRAMLSKATGYWRPNVQVQAFSPGFETNDAGFMQRTDIISTHALMQYVNQNPSGQFREKDGWFGVWENRNFDGNTLDHGAFADLTGIFQNYWTAHTSFFLNEQALSDRLTRGGPLARTPAGWSNDLNLGTDDRQTLSFGLNGHVDRSGDGSYTHTLGLTASARPRTSLQLSVGPIFTRSHDHTAYVTTIEDPTATSTFGSRYVFADLEQHSFELDTRVDWTLTSHLSFQLYLQPFVASGDYHDYHSLAAARTRDYTPFTASVVNPDFNFRSVRGSAVFRWEFRPGSALYVVWNENRADTVPIGDFSFRRDLGAIPTAPSHDVFLVKVSYWLPT
jgi:hypothetical protein